MKAAEFAFYMHFTLNKELVRHNGEWVERKNPRYDLDATAGSWTGFEKLLSRKRTMSISILPTTQNANYKHDGTAPSRYMSMKTPGVKSSYNLSGLMPLVASKEEGRQISCGYPARRHNDNPLYEERYDGFIIVESDFDEAHQAQTLEIFVIRRYAGVIHEYLKAVNIGTYDSVMAAMRKNAKPYGSGV